MTQSQRTSRGRHSRSMSRKTFAKRQWPASGETRPKADSARPPNTGHFGESARRAAPMPSPEVEAVKRFTQNTKSNSPPRIHHQHHPVAESGDTLESRHMTTDNCNVTAEPIKACGESTGFIAKPDTLPAEALW